MPWRCAMAQSVAGSTEPPRWTWSSVSSSPNGCGRAGLASLFSRRWTPDAPAAARLRRTALGVLAPDDLAVVVGGRHLHQAVPDLGATELLLAELARERAL